VRLFQYYKNKPALFEVFSRPALVRTGIKRLLEDSKEVEIIGEADTGETSLKLVQELNPDVVLMDVNMPGMGGVEASRRILQRDPDKKIIILTIHNEQTFPKRLLEIGAKGYLTKECDLDEMIFAIKQVANGGSYIEPRIAQQLALTLLPGNNDNPVDKLSRREFQVMLMISHGLSNVEISEKLCLSPEQDVISWIKIFYQIIFKYQSFTLSTCIYNLNGTYMTDKRLCFW